MAGIQKVHLNNLNTNLRNALVVGIIIAKNSPKIFGTKKKTGDMRGVTSFTLRDSEFDTINCDVWGSEYFVTTLYERFLVGDVVEISSPKIMVKKSDNEIFKPQVTSPFYLSMNEGQSDISIYCGDNFNFYLPLLHIPSKPASGYHGLSEILKLPESEQNIYVDLLVVVKSVSPVKAIKTKNGADMFVRSVEIMDNTTPATLKLDLFELDSIQRAGEWRASESVVFVADARARGRGGAGGAGAALRACARTVLTHQPHTADAEALRLYARNQTETLEISLGRVRGGRFPFSSESRAAGGGEAAAWAAWSGERACAASVAQVRERARAAPFCASLHALLTRLDIDDLFTDTRNKEIDELRVTFADHTGELGMCLPIHVLEDCLGYTLEQLQALNSNDRSALRWKFFLEQCVAKIAASPTKLLVLELRRATAVDPIPLY